MSGAEWGITADEARAIVAEAAGEVLVRGGHGRGRLVHPGRLLAVTNTRAQIHTRGGSGAWFSLEAIKPAAGKSRSVVDSMRAKREPKNRTIPDNVLAGIHRAIAAQEATENTESTETTETPMPPDYAPRPQPSAKSFPVMAPAATAAKPAETLPSGSLLAAASRIESAIKAVDAKRADVEEADRNLADAKELVRIAVKALEEAEASAKKLATEFNELVAKATR